MRASNLPSLLLGTLLACNQADPMVDDDASSGGATTNETNPAETEAGTGTDPGPGTDSPTTADSGDTAGTADGETDEPPVEGDFYPLVDGATWTYRHSDDLGAVFDEVVQMHAVDYMGMTAYQAEDNEDSNMENSLAILVRNGTETNRIHKDMFLAGVLIGTVDYDPGFLRFDESWANATEGQTFEWSYDRAEYDASGVPAGVVETRVMTFTIESTSVEVTVPAGTFDCVQVRRERLDNGEVKRYWFARNVGKVKHESVGSSKTEELIEYSIP